MPEQVYVDQVKKQFNDVLADDITISNLCDCGRHKCIHKRMQNQQKGAFPKSDYMSTYQVIKHPKPRSSKRPIVAVRESCPAPMHFSTNQRDHFKNYGNVERVKPITNIAKYKPSNQRMDTLTHYLQEFTPKQMNLESSNHHKDSHNLIPTDDIKFDATTSNKEHFQRWVSKPPLHFGELTSFTGGLLFPDKGYKPQSITMQSYTGLYTPSLQLAKPIPDNIQLEGDREFDTTHNATYRKIDGSYRMKPHTCHDKTRPRRQHVFQGVSQTQQDFPGFQGKQPCPPKPIEPPLSTLDWKFNNKQSFTTENRTIFQGHDVREHPVAKSCKMADHEYRLPSEKMAAETSQKRDYQPIDTNTLRDVNKQILATRSEPLVEANFDGKTMNNQFFQKWNVQPRIRYGYFHDHKPYLPRRDDFNAQSITKTSFVMPTSVNPSQQLCRPEERSMFNNEQMNFKTEYQEEFQKRQAHLCPAQVYLMQKKIQQLQQKNQHSSEAHVAHMTSSNAEVVA